MRGILPNSRRPAANGAEEPSDEALLAACAGGDRTALADLFHRHSAALYGFLSRFPGVDDRDLDDLVQATFVAVHRSATRFEGSSSVRTWIFGIAANLVRKHVRGEVHGRNVRNKVEELPVPEPIRPDAEAEHRQALARIDAALAELPHDLKAVFTLCVIEGASGKEAARALGIREGTLWRRLHEARTALRRAVDGMRP
ncbi:RNA polymerase sigma factor [Vulgatibacter incomptus]|uniref:RNA polymerase sigma-70 factor, ECF subfamily n=1 Tax=Vulgatibacter incomptus TaxID=1391653 RepID=A0A0K1PCF0_9BACT|nr:RNA polymerase sigma factor [Vulgatibacter incomptus]AKU91187.1 RNA polymerase sigma-70 factor, ECF subfamily [Vulgatibacter incomptus]